MTPNQTYLLSEQLVINSETIQDIDIVAQLQVALPQLLDVLTRFGQDSTFTLKPIQKESNFKFHKAPRPSMLLTWVKNIVQHR